MEKYREYYKATKGKHFVLTEKGVTEVASYRHYKVGEPLDYGYSGEYCVSHRDVEEGYVIEENDPTWVTLPGYRAVYDIHKDGKTYTFDVGNHQIYHDKEMAELAVKEFDKRPWMEGRKGYVIDAVYEGKMPKKCREYNGKRVLNMDYWSYDRPIGSLVEEDIVMEAANCVPPRNFSNGYIQCGEPHSTKKEGNTYATFVRVNDNIWEWKGNCLAGKEEESGTAIPYVG